MKNFTIILTVFLLMVTPNINTQTVAPLKLGNIWVYDYTSNLSRTIVVDTSVYFDSISYCKLFNEDNYGMLKYYTYARLREDGYYVLFSVFDSTEAKYYKKNAVIGDTWTVGTLKYTIEDTIVANVFGEQTTIKLLIADD
jgi:hypothetical protein